MDIEQQRVIDPDACEVGGYDHQGGASAGPGGGVAEQR